MYESPIPVHDDMRIHLCEHQDSSVRPQRSTEENPNEHRILHRNAIIKLECERLKERRTEIEERMSGAAPERSQVSLGKRKDDGRQSTQARKRQKVPDEIFVRAVRLVALGDSG